MTRVWTRKLFRLGVLGALVAALIFSTASGYAKQLIDAGIYPRKYREHVEQYADSYGVEPNLVYAMIKAESGFRPNVVSYAGAIGLMQVMPETYEQDISKKIGMEADPSLLYDPETNIRYGVYYLRYLYSKFGYNPDLVSAAYNGGEGNVSEWLLDQRYADGEGGLRDYPDGFDETRDYVKKIRNSRKMYQKLYY